MSTMSHPSIPTPNNISPSLPTDILSHLCYILSDISYTQTLTQLAQSSADLRELATPALYRHLTLKEDNIIQFFSSSLSDSNRTPSWSYTKHLHIQSLPIDFPESILPSFTDPTESTLFPNVRSIIIGSEAIWQLIVRSHTHPTPHPLITFLKAHTSPNHLTIHYPNSERTAHSHGGGYCCCAAAIRIFQQNPKKAAAFDRSSTSRLISSLAKDWVLDRLSLKGLVDDFIPLDLDVQGLEVEWEACQCSDEKFHGEWCFNHVYPMKRVEQVKEVLIWAKGKGVGVKMEGVERVGGVSDGEDVGKWINARLAEVKKKEEEHDCTLSL